MDAPRRNPLIEFFAVAVRPRTYGAVAYLWLGFPLGLAWFVALTVGFTTGLALAILWVGFLILAATLALAWLAEGVERQLAIHLLGARVPERRSGPAPATTRARLGAELTSPALWKGMLFLLLRLPVALACWVTSLVSLVVPAAFAALPVLYLVADPATIHFDLPFWAVDSFATPMPGPMRNVADLDSEFWSEGMAMFDNYVSPWLRLVDDAKYQATVDRVAALDTFTIVGCHTPVIPRSHVGKAIELARKSPTAEFAPPPEQDVLEQIQRALTAGAEGVAA